MVQPSSSGLRTDSPPPLKRARQTDMDPYSTNGSQQHSQSHPYSSQSNAGTSGLPPLSLSILGVEPLDEFIREIADFVHHMIVTRAADYPTGHIEVEAKVGVLKDRATGKRLYMPVLVETSMCIFSFPLSNSSQNWNSLWRLRELVLKPEALDIRFESNMSSVRFPHWATCRRSTANIYMSSQYIAPTQTL